MPQTHSIKPTQKSEEATPIELFFDLVFVFAFLELSHHMSAHLSWRSIAETLVMLSAVLIVWIYTSWIATIVRGAKAHLQWMLLIVMGLGLFMNVGIGKAFEDGPWLFVIPMLIIEFGRTIWAISFAPKGGYHDHYKRALVWTIIIAPFWIIGALADPELRLVWWLFAAAISVLGTWLAHPLPWKKLNLESLPFDATHFLERCSLFLLIALGETILAIGLSLSESKIDVATLTTATFALLLSVAYWAILFGGSRTRSHDFLNVTTDTVRVGRYAVNSIILSVSGLVFTAVATQQVIGDESGHLDILFNLCLVGGPILFLIGHAAYMRLLPDFKPRYHVLGIGALLIFGGASLHVEPFISLISVAIFMSVFAMFTR